MAQYQIFRAVVNYKFLAGVEVATASIIAAYPTVDAMRIKSEGTRVNVNRSHYVPATFDNESGLITGDYFTFDKDCLVILGKYISI